MAIDSLNKLAISSYALKFASDSLPNKLIIIEGLEKAFQLTQQKIQEKPQNTSPQEIIKNLDVKADPTDKIDELIEDVAPNKN